MPSRSELIGTTADRAPYRRAPYCRGGWGGSQEATWMEREELVEVSLEAEGLAWHSGKACNRVRLSGGRFTLSLPDCRRH